MKDSSPINLMQLAQVVVIRAFVGEIDWNIVAIKVAVEPDKALVTVYHENILNESQAVDLKFVEADIVEALLGKLDVSFKTVKIDSPEALPPSQMEFCIYRRKVSIE